MNSGARAVASHRGGPLEVRLPTHLGSSRVEEIACELLAERHDELVLDITDLQRSRLFADARLLGLLATASALGIRVTVVLGSELPSFDATTSENKYWKLFLHSVTGLVLTEYAERVLGGGSDYLAVVRAAQKQCLLQNSGVVGSGKEMAAPIIDRLGRPAVAAFAEEADITRFAPRMRHQLFARFGLPNIDEVGLERVADFLFETLQNTRDHALCDLDQRPMKGMRFLSMRRLNAEQEPIDALANDGDFPTPVRNYLLRLSESLTPKNRQRLRLVEFTVADSGVGIPARMAQSMGIYDAGVEEEYDQVRKALERSGTSKGRNVTGAGLGLYKVMQATARLQALFIVRTGRTYLSRHYLAGEPWPSLIPNNAASVAYPLIRGTSVSILMPWIDTTQLDLFPR